MGEIRIQQLDRGCRRTAERRIAGVEETLVIVFKS
jgi:hypothetical protein